jgi:hypothetical protein
MDLFCPVIVEGRTSSAYFDRLERVLRLSIEIPSSYLEAFGNDDVQLLMFMSQLFFKRHQSGSLYLQK